MDAHYDEDGNVLLDVDGTLFRIGKELIYFVRQSNVDGSVYSFDCWGQYYDKTEAKKKRSEDNTDK